MFNYKTLTFEEHHGENFHVLSTRFLDYDGVFREITLTMQAIGRKSLWIAQFSGFTTEYSGNIAEVLEKTHEYYLSNCWKSSKE